MFFFTNTLMGLESFSTRAQEALALARVEAAALNHNAVNPDHLTAGLFKLGQGVACDVLRLSGLDLDVMHAEATTRAGPKGNERPSGTLPYTYGLKKVFRLAAKEARRLDHHYVGTEHLLLALLRNGSLRASPSLNIPLVLQAIGIEHGTARAK